MSYADPDRERENARERKRRYRAKQHAKKFGPGACDMRGKHGNHVSGRDHPRWNDSQILSSDGYVKVRVGKSHPLADPNGYAYEHLVIWISSGRRSPTPNEVLHHRNEIKTDNRLENLEIISRSRHNAHHLTERTRDEKGRFLKRAAGDMLDGRQHHAWPEVRI